MFATFCATSSVVGCGSVCTDDETIVQTRGGTAHQRSLVESTWSAFAQAISPEAVCLSSIRIGGALRDAGGRYRTVDRQIVVDDSIDFDGDLETAVGHELCHAWDLQVLKGRPDTELFWFHDTFRFTPERGNEAREAFAIACGLGPQVIAAAAETSCGTGAPEEGLAYLDEDVFASAPQPQVDIAYREVLLDLPAAVNPARVEALQACERSNGETVIDVMHGGTATQLRVDGERGTVDVVDDPIGCSSPDPEEAQWPLSITGPQAVAGGAWADTEVWVVHLPWPTGDLQRVWIRRSGQTMRPAANSCALPLEPAPPLRFASSAPLSAARIAFFVGEADTTLSSVSISHDARIVLTRWR